jgi:AraC-like DNA-binding protein
MVNATTVGDAIASLVAMTNAHTPNVRATFEVKGDRAELSWINPAGIIAPRQHFAAFAVTAIFNRLRQSAGEPWLSVIEAHFEFCKPADTRLLRGVFGQSLLFDQPGNGFAIDAASLSRPLQTANPALFAIATDLATRWMMDASAPDIVLAVRQEIAARLTTGTATLETVAASLDLTTSQLQWRLEQAGTTFERLTGRMRQDMAAHLLRNTDKPMMDIAFELGFSDQSTFTRAARRWFNVPPAEYRRRVRRMRRGEPPE